MGFRREIVRVCLTDIDKIFGFDTFIIMTATQLQNQSMRSNIIKRDANDEKAKHRPHH